VLHEENVLLSMLLQPCKNTKNAFNTYDNIFTLIKLIPTHNNNCYKCRILIQIIIILTVFHINVKM
jgi:hypothetical protein